MIQRERGGEYVSLDSSTALESARRDPTGFVTGFDEPGLIDEIQRGGDPLVTAIKLEVDRSPRRGRIVIAGSTRFLTEPRLSESLAFAGLRALQRRLGDRFAGGVLQHFGDRPRPFGPGLVAVPVAAVWSVAPS